MIYRVELTAKAKADADKACRWIRQFAPASAARWYARLRAAIDSLEANPERCSLAPEAEVFQRPIRQLLYGKRRGIYRILFEIHKDTVYVLHIRHGARRNLEPDFE